MIIDVYAHVYNEEKILPYWLRHYETFADRIFVWEIGSTDSTRKILEAHPKVILLPIERAGTDDEWWVNVLFPRYKDYSRGVSDYVITADADEFIYHPNMRKMLEESKQHGIELIRTEGYAMISEKFPTTRGQIYEEIKLGLPDRLESKWSIHSPDVDVHYRFGRHYKPYNFYSFKKGYQLGFKLLHYRYLGEAYFEERDKKVFNTMNMAFPGVYPQQIYSRKIWGHRTTPDGSKGDVYDWYNRNKVNAHNVLDIEIPPIFP